MDCPEMISTASGWMWYTHTATINVRQAQIRIQFDIEDIEITRKVFISWYVFGQSLSCKFIIKTWGQIITRFNFVIYVPRLLDFQSSAKSTPTMMITSFQFGKKTTLFVKTQIHSICRRYFCIKRLFRGSKFCSSTSSFLFWIVC